MSVYYFISSPSKIYVFEVVDNNKRPSASCSAHTGVAGRGAARHNFPSHGVRRDPPEPATERRATFLAGYYSVHDFHSKKQRLYESNAMFKTTIFSHKKVYN